MKANNRANVNLIFQLFKGISVIRKYYSSHVIKKHLLSSSYCVGAMLMCRCFNSFYKLYAFFGRKKSTNFLCKQLFSIKTCQQQIDTVQKISRRKNKQTFEFYIIQLFGKINSVYTKKNTHKQYGHFFFSLNLLSK